MRKRAINRVFRSSGTFDIERLRACQHQLSVVGICGNADRDRLSLPRPNFSLTFVAPLSPPSFSPLPPPRPLSPLASKSLNGHLVHGDCTVVSRKKEDAIRDHRETRGGALSCASS